MVAATYGFSPDPVFRKVNGNHALYRGEIVFWWHRYVLLQFHAFSPSKQNEFAQSLEHFLADGGEKIFLSTRPIPRTAKDVEFQRLAADLPITEARELLPIIDRKAWSWRRADDAIIVDNSPPLPERSHEELLVGMPSTDAGIGFETEFTEDFEINRLGLDPALRKGPRAAHVLELDIGSWHNVLYTSRAYGFTPLDGRWAIYARYYTVRNPSMNHAPINTGYIRIGGFDQIDSDRFVSSLRAAIQDGLQRRSPLLGQNKPSDYGLVMDEAVTTCR